MEEEDRWGGEDAPEAFGDALVDEGESGALIDAPAPPASAPLALYRRYRPDTFADVIGQEHVTEPLQRALVNNRVNHAYLFSGPRGCGKTTSARILARALNCEKGPAAEPCGQCQSCQDLARGGPGSIDVIEIDAASHGGVDDARDLRERAFFAPVHSRYKIYIVDEAHMVTTAGFNALLKLVEEPPPHVKFIFATTEPEKVIGTIRSRTHHYPFRLVPPKVLSAYLAQLCDAEGIAVEPAVLPLVVRAGGGSVRDSLSVLDQLLGGAAETGVSYRQATALLGFTPDSLLDEVLDAFAAGDAAGVFSAVDKVIEVGQDPRRFAEDLLRRLRDLVIVSAVPDALSSGLVDVAADQGERLQAQAAALGSGELTRAAEVIAAGLTEMRGTTAPRLHLELMCARVLLPGADVDDRGIHARLDRLERRLAMGGSGAGVVEAPAAPPQYADAPVTRPPVEAQPYESQAQPHESQGATRLPQPEQESPPGQKERGLPAEAPEQSGPESPAPSDPSTQTPTQPSAPAGTQPSAPAGTQPPAPAGTQPSAPAGTQPSAPAASTSGGLSVADVRRLWPEVLDEVKRRRRFTWILLSQNAQVVGVDDGVLTLGLTNAGARDSFARGGSESVLADALVQVIGANLRIEALVDPATPHDGGRRQPPAVTRPAASEQRRDDAYTPEAPAHTAPEGQRQNHLRAVPSEPPPDADQEPEPPAESSPEPAPSTSLTPGVQEPPPSDPGASSRARDAIRPTRLRAVRENQEDDDPGQGADRSDSDLEESPESHNELLARHLGAELIGEETPDSD